MYVHVRTPIPNPSFLICGRGLRRGKPRRARVPISTLPRTLNMEAHVAPDVLSKLSQVLSNLVLGDNELRRK